MDSNVNRVYLNPNFSRTPNVMFATNQTVLRKNVHVIPYFSMPVPCEQQTVKLNSNRRIYVNPNFIKPNTTSDNITNQYSDFNTQQKNTAVKDYHCLNTVDLHPVHINNIKPKPLEIVPPSIVSKSKYTLIRNNTNVSIDKKIQTTESCTIKISKYKSIPMKSFKSNLQIINKPETPSKEKDTNRNMSVSTPKYVSKTSFKLIRQNKNTTVHTPSKLTPRSNLLKMKRNHDLGLQISHKVSKNIRKKNNIPCRLFTKYGKCIRNLSGTCQYVHDKKHVSLCRKFIKGICHDKDCSLSHELSSKKMPTCYFYLKGMCVKESCPYTHVKVSEQSKICNEFLKGYCDKGDTCLYRHITPLPNKIDSKKVSNVNSNKRITINKTSKSKASPLTKNKISRRLERKQSENKVSKEDCANEQDKQDLECRYFKDDIINEDNMCEVLKPTRCKLGPLPSFIQL